MSDDRPDERPLHERLCGNWTQREFDDVGHIARTIARRILWKHTAFIEDAAEDATVHAIQQVSDRCGTEKQVLTDGFIWDVVRKYLISYARKLDVRSFVKTLDPSDPLWELFGSDDPDLSIEELADKLAWIAEAFFRRTNQRCLGYFQRFYMGSDQLQELAREFGLSPNAAAVQWRRCLKKLRGFLGEDDPGRYGIPQGGDA